AGCAAALAVAALVGLPMFLRNQRLFRDPIYPLLAHDLDRRLYQMNVHHFSLPGQVFHEMSLATAGPLVVATGLFALGLAAVEGRGPCGPVCGAATRPAAVAAPRAPPGAPRPPHPLIPPLALLGAGALSAAIGARRFPSIVVSAALFAAAAFSIVRIPDL